MARFLISPGVITREIDQSQYAATTPGTGNIAALIGYAEKGPFEPTLVYGVEDFVQKFGKTLRDVPYLAQAVYKYFEEGDSALIVRAGDDRDPDTYSSAAQYASKTVRIDPTDVPATGGYQQFSLSGGAVTNFTPGATYGCRISTDYRAFTEAKTIEKFIGTIAETYSNLSGGTVPNIFYKRPILKLAYVSGNPNSFNVHLKINEHDTRSGSIVSTAWYSGTGSRSGNTGQGDTFTANLTAYDSAGLEYDDTWTLSGVYGAATVGSVNILSGNNTWTTTPASFNITLGLNTYTVTLDADCVDTDAIVTLINTKLLTADNGGTPTDITDKIQAFKLQNDDTTSYIALKHIDDTENGFTLAAGTTDALVQLGLTASTYNDTDWITGSYNSVYTDAVPSTVNSSGNFAFNISSTNTNQMSFEEYIDIELTAPGSGSWSKADIVTALNTQLQQAYYPSSRTPDGAIDLTVNKPSDPGISTSAPDPRSARGWATVDINDRIRISAGNVQNDGVFSTISSTDDYVSRVRILSTDSTGGTLVSLLGGVATAVDGASTSSIGESKLIIKAKEKGSYGNNLILRTETETITSGTTTITNKNVYILLDGKEVAVYLKVDWENTTADNYILTKIANDLYIEIEAEDEDGNSTMAELPVGDWQLGNGDLPDSVTETQAEVVEYTVGTNGWTESAGIITSMSADFVNGLVKIANPEVYEFNIVSAPGDASATVQNGIQALCDSRRDCFGVIDGAQFGLGLGISNSTNSIDEVNDASSTLTSSYVGAFWGWLQDYDADNQQYVWLPPSIYAVKAMVYTDNTADPWFAPAGTRRGRVNALDVEYSPTRVERDVIYGDGKIVNPIVKFVNEGILIWGQKTAQRTKSATDRISVRRLLIYAEKLIARMARGFLFEPNDPANWNAFARQANAILEPIRQRRGLYTYTVQCDENTNTPALINQNIMAGKIFLQPTKTTEFIEVEFTINAADGATTINE